MKNLKDFVSDQELYYTTTGTIVREAVAYMCEKDIGAVCVLDGDRLVGMFSERDLMTRVVNKDLDPQKVKVGEVMTTEITVAEGNESIQVALERMRKFHCRHMPVIEDKKLIGVVSLRKLLLHDVTAKEEEIKLLDAYITYAPVRME